MQLAVLLRNKKTKQGCTSWQIFLKFGTKITFCNILNKFVDQKNPEYTLWGTCGGGPKVRFLEPQGKLLPYHHKLTLSMVGQIFMKLLGPFVVFWLTWCYVYEEKCVTIFEFDPNLLKIRKDRKSLHSRQRAISNLKYKWIRINSCWSISDRLKRTVFLGVPKTA